MPLRGAEKDENMEPVTAVAIVVLGVSLGALFASLIILLKVRAETKQSRETFNKLQSELEALSAKSEQEVARCSQGFDKLDSETRQRLGKLDGALAEAGNRVSGVDQRVSEVDRRVAGVGQRVGELDQRLSGVDQRVARYQDEAADIREGLSRAQDLLAETREKLNRFEEYTRDFLERELSQAFFKFDRTVGSVLGEMKSELLHGVERIGEIQSVVESKTEAQRRIFGGAAGARMLGESREAGPLPPDGGETEGKDEGTPFDFGEPSEDEVTAFDFDEPSEEGGAEDSDDAISTAREAAGEPDSADEFPGEGDGEAEGEPFAESEGLEQGASPDDDSTPDAETSLFGPADVEAAELEAEAFEDSEDKVAYLLEREDEADEPESAPVDLDAEEAPAPEEGDAADAGEAVVEDAPPAEDAPDEGSGVAEGAAVSEEEDAQGEGDATEAEGEKPEAERGRGEPDEMLPDFEEGWGEARKRPFDQPPAEERLATPSQPAPRASGRKARFGRGLPALVRRMNKRPRSRPHVRGTRLNAHLRRRR